MIRHVVVLSWNEKVSKAAVQAVTDGFAALPDRIPEIRSYEFGPDLELNKRNANYVLIADFETSEDFETYVSHPDHVALMKDLCSPILDSFRAVQFERP